jgi:hypothetical protein
LSNFTSRDHHIDFDRNGTRDAARVSSTIQFTLGGTHGGCVTWATLSMVPCFIHHGEYTDRDTPVYQEMRMYDYAPQLQLDYVLILGAVDHLTLLIHL